MPNDLPPEAIAELRSLFLRELRNGLEPTRQACDTLVRNPADRDALQTLRGFFHRLAGDAGSADYVVLSNLASACEAAADVALETPGPLHPRTLRALAKGLEGARTTLDGEGLLPVVGVSPSPDVASIPVLGKDDEGAPARIAIIEDDPYSAKLIETCLAIAGFRSAWYQDPDVAMAAIETAPPDLILLDVQMPKLSGFDICIRIRKHPGLQLVPVIFVTQHRDLAERIHGLEVGANDYIVKPFDPRELVARVGSHLSRLSALREMAIRDGLTRCYNHKYFKSRLEQELARSQRHGSQLALAILDVDHFKSVNDGYGHLAGDVVLATLGGLVSASVRSTDIVARYGGEEFGLIFVESGASEATVITERIRARVAQHVFALPDGVGVKLPDPVRLTVSLGVTECAKSDNLQRALQRADEALYGAKAAGRNKVCVT